MSVKQVDVQIKKFYPKGTPYSVLYKSATGVMTTNKTAFVATYGEFSLTEEVFTMTSFRWAIRREIKKKVKAWVKRFRLPGWMMKDGWDQFTLKVRS